MEAVEDTYVEAAILWLAQTILASLLAGKLEAWLRQVGLADDTEKLRYEIERVETVVAAGKGRATGNKLLARCLCRLKELMYDADDVVDELDYCRLKHQVEGDPTACATEPESTYGHGAEQADGSRYNPDTMSSSGGKKRSKAWGEFRITEEVDGKPAKAECIHCHTVVRCETSKGTSVLHNHLKSDSCKRKRAAIEQTPNPSSAGDGVLNGHTGATVNSASRKRIRIDEMSTHDTPLEKNEFSSRIQQMSRQLQEAMIEVQKLYGSDSVASNLYRNTAADPRRRTSSLVQRKMYGRVAEKNSIIKLMTGDKSDGVIILPIVGIGGIGKTTLAQLVYNDPTVKSQFDHRIWVWVSNDFDEVRLTREMLDFVSQERHEGISSLAKLQEMLVSHVTSKRFLLILDDVWDDMNDHRWNKLLAPLKFNNVKGNVILVTTRILSVAKRIGTVEPIELGGLQDDDFWLLFRACAFGDDKYEGHPSLNIIGRQIAEKLQGNPLAAETAGMLLREDLTTDHWSNILKNEKWKSLKLNGGIMPALKLSYDELPYYLQQCFLYCSIFPNNHQFLSTELVCNWISQGFVKCGNSNMRLEEIGRNYLADLVNSGFFQQVGTLGFTSSNETCYVISVLMHDFTRQVSRNLCATIDGLECTEMPPSIRHLSIVTDVVYHKDQRGKMLRNDKFEEKVRRVTTKVTKLRTLVLIGEYDSLFFRLFQDIFQKAQYLRVLQMSAEDADFASFLCNLVNSTHLRYLKLDNEEGYGALPQSVSKFYHLQTLDVGQFGDPMIPNHINSLVSLRHLIGSLQAYSSIEGVGKMTSLQELHDFRIENSSDLKITQLQSMNELLQLGVSRLENVGTRDEASGARLRGKRHLEKLRLSWQDLFPGFPLDEYDGDTTYEISMDTEGEEGSSSMDDINNSRSSEQFVDTAKEVLEGLEPHRNLKHLHISGYSGATSPAWLGTSVFCLQTLHLEDCGEWQILPSLGRLSFLTKLKLRKMRKVIEVSIPSLEVLVLVEMPNLEKCSCNSVRDLNSSLRVLKIMRCRVLKVFPLFESCEKHKIEKRSWLSRLSKLTIHDCPCLRVAYPLPPSSSGCKLSIVGVSTLPMMVGSSTAKLRIDYLDELDHNVLEFHNLRFLSHLILEECRNLLFTISEGFSQLINLQRLEIYSSDIFSSYVSYVLLKDTDEDMAAVNFIAPPSLKHLKIVGFKIKWMLQQVQALEELHLEGCHIRGLSLEDDPEASSSGNSYDASKSSASYGLLCIPSNIVSSLQKMIIIHCGDPTFYGSKDGFARFTSLEELTIRGCPKLISPLVCKAENNDQASERWLLPDSLGRLEMHLYSKYRQLDSLETLQLCFPGNMTCLKNLQIWDSPSLKCLQLDSCTALEKMTISGCGSLTALEGLQSLSSLKSLFVSRNPGFLPPNLEHLSSQGYPTTLVRLETLHIDDYCYLTKSFCKHLTSLQRLHLCTSFSKVTILTDEHERALQLLTSLQELRFASCHELAHLPLGLHSLPSLKRLNIIACRSISKLPQMGLPPTLEELYVNFCSDELTEQCRKLATSKLKVKVGWEYVN